MLFAFWACICDRGYIHTGACDAMSMYSVPVCTYICQHTSITTNQAEDFSSPGVEGVTPRTFDLASNNINFDPEHINFPDGLILLPQGTTAEEALDESTSSSGTSSFSVSSGSDV